MARVFLHLLLSFCVAVCISCSSIHLSYDPAQEGAILSPEMLVQLAQRKNVSNIYLCDANPKVLEVLSGSGIEVGVGISEIEAKEIGKSKDYASSWLKNSVVGFLPGTLITSIVVGPLSLDGTRGLDLKSIWKALGSSLLDEKLEKQIEIIPVLAIESENSLSVLTLFLKSAFTESSLIILKPSGTENLENFKHVASSVMIPASKAVPHLLSSSDFKAPSGSAIIIQMDALRSFSQRELLREEVQFSSRPRKLREKENKTDNLDDSLVDTFPTVTPTTPMTYPNTPMTTTPTTTPFTSPTVPTLTPTTPLTPPTTTTPFTSPTTAAGTWCVAKPGVPDQSLQVALDYACGLGGADCGAIQPGGSCYNPNTVAAHASYAFDSYYKKNGMAAGTCDFGGNAIVTNQDPSSGTCTYSTSVGAGSSVLNTSISGTGGLGGMSPDTESSGTTSLMFAFPFFFTVVCLLLSFIDDIIESK